MRTPDEQTLYQKKVHVARVNAGRYGGKCSVVARKRAGTFERGMNFAALSSVHARSQRTKEKKAQMPVGVMRRDWHCPRPRCGHRWRSKSRNPEHLVRCPRCWKRLGKASALIASAKLGRELQKQPPPPAQIEWVEVRNNAQTQDKMLPVYDRKVITPWD